MQDSVAIVVAKLVLFTVFVVVAVMVVDVVALWRLSLLTDADTWFVLLLYEGLVTLVFGVAGFFYMLPTFLGGVPRGRLYKVYIRFRQTPLSSVAIMAGLVLCVLSVYLGT